MRPSHKAKAALEKVVEQLQTGDLSPLVAVLRLQDTGIPSDHWSLCNRFSVMIQKGTLDCRGIKQWRSEGRYLNGGCTAAFILVPVFREQEREDGTTHKRLITFRSCPVYAVHDTRGKPLEAKELPPLYDLAVSMGVKVEWMPLPSDRVGDCTVKGDKIRLDSHDWGVFFHELAHAAHARIEILRPGQITNQEVVAEITATVLMEMYGHPRTGNCYRYISMYADDPLRAIGQAIADVEKILAVLHPDFSPGNGMTAYYIQVLMTRHGMGLQGMAFTARSVGACVVERPVVFLMKGDRDAADDVSEGRGHTTCQRSAPE